MRSASSRPHGRLMMLLVAGVAASVVLGACGGGAEEVTVSAIDYAFVAPTELSAGETTFSFQNDGTVDHEMVLLRLKEAGTFGDAMAAFEGGADPEGLLGQFFEDVPEGVIFATPGTTGRGSLTVDLTEGEYAFFCFFQDSPEDPPHVALGMVTNLNVSG